ncbi:MAG: hypothetical protein Q9160_003376 [Pyrenula sp. 1 TL-2023]
MFLALDSEFDGSRCFDNLKLAVIDSNRTSDIRQEHLRKLDRMRPQVIQYTALSTVRDLLGDSISCPSQTKREAKDSSHLATIFLASVKDFVLEKIRMGTLNGMRRLRAPQETGIALPALANPEDVDKVLSILNNAGFKNIYVVSEPAAAALYLFYECRKSNDPMTSRGPVDLEPWMLEKDQPLLVANVGHGTAVCNQQLLLTRD